MKIRTFRRTAFSGHHKPWMVLCALALLVFFVAASASAGGGAPKKQTWTDKWVWHTVGKGIGLYTKAKAWVSHKVVNKVKGFFSGVTEDPMLNYMSEKERRMNEEARQRILKVMRYRQFDKPGDKLEWQKRLFDDLVQDGIVAKDPRAKGGDGGASQFWYDLEHKSGQFKKIPARALKIEQQLRIRDIDYRNDSNQLGYTRGRMLSKEYRKGGEAAGKEYVNATDKVTKAGEFKEAIKGKIDEAKKKVQQGIEIADATKKGAQWAGRNVDDALGKNKTLKENQKNLNDLKRQRALEKAKKKPAGAEAAKDKEKGEDAGKKGTAGLDQKKVKKPREDKLSAGSMKIAKKEPDRIVDDGGREIRADELEEGDTVLSKNGDEYEKRNGKLEKTGENYGTYTPTPEEGTGRKTKSARDSRSEAGMTPEEWHEKLKKNDPEAWKKMGDALKSGDPDKIDAVIKALGAKSTGGEGGGDPLRDAEEESGGAADAGDTYMPPTSPDGNPLENPNSWVPSGREATAAERGESAQAANADRMGRIAAQGQSVDENIANAANQHGSAESAAQGQRQRSSAVADAIMGGLTSGVAAGVDAAAGTIGAGAGNVVAGKIAPEKNHSAGGPGASSGAGSTASTATGSSETPWTGVFKGSFPFQFCMDGTCGKKIMIHETLHIVQHGNQLTGTGEIAEGVGSHRSSDGIGIIQGSCSGRSAHIRFGGNEHHNNMTLSGDGRTIFIDGGVLRRISKEPARPVQRPRHKTKRPRPKPGHGGSDSCTI